MGRVVNGRGTVVCAGHTMHVTEIRLVRGRIEVWATARGPIPATRDAHVTVFGEDGIGVGQCENALSWEDVPLGAQLLVHLDMTVTEMTNMRSV